MEEKYHKFLIWSWGGGNGYVWIFPNKIFAYFVFFACWTTFPIAGPFERLCAHQPMAECALRGLRTSYKIVLKYGVKNIWDRQN